MAANASLYLRLVVLITSDRKDGRGGALEAAARQCAERCLSRGRRAHECKCVVGGRPPVAAFGRR